MTTEEPGIEEFATVVQETLDQRPKVSSLWPLVGLLVVAGLVLTLALRTDTDWLYVLGLALTVVWVAGLYLARGQARWFRW